MTEQDQSLLSVLTWAVNPNLPTPTPTDLNHERLIELVQYHRILGPLIRRVNTARPTWFPLPLLTRLRLSQHHVRQSVYHRLAAAREISAAMQAAGHHAPIIIKGFAAYALTGHPDLLHVSSDIDPFAEDLPALWDVTHALGYTGKRKDTHEWAKLTRDDVTLDVHQHYPINSYPTDVWAAPGDEMQPSHHPGHWRLPTRSLDLLPEDNRIRWPDLKANAVPGIAFGTEDLLFPSPAMLCLLHCAHCFHSAVTRLHYITRSGDARLFELLSIYQLSCCSSFDAPEFRALVSRFSAQDAVGFVNRLMHAFLGTQIPEGSAETATEKDLRFPEHLIYGGWIMTQSIDDFLLPHDLPVIYRQLGAITLAAQASVAGKDLPRLMLYGVQAHPPLNVSVDWDVAKETLQVCWEAQPASDARQEFLIHFGHNAPVIARQAADGSLATVTQKPDFLQFVPLPSATWQRGATDSLSITCNVPVVPGFDPERLHIFIAMCRVSADGNQTEAACYIPLILQAQV